MARASEGSGPYRGGQGPQCSQFHKTMIWRTPQGVAYKGDPTIPPRKKWRRKLLILGFAKRLNVLTRTAEGQSTSIAAKLAFVRAVLRVRTLGRKSLCADDTLTHDSSKPRCFHGATPQRSCQGDRLSRTLGSHRAGQFWSVLRFLDDPVDDLIDLVPPRVIPSVCRVLD